MQSTCTDATVTRVQSVSQTAQRQCNPTETTKVPSLSYPKPSAAPLQSPDEHSDNIKLNTAIPRVASIAPLTPKRKRGVKYAGSSRTASNARMKLTGLPPTPALSLVDLQVLSGSAHGSLSGLNSASVQDPVGLHTVHYSSKGPRELVPPTRHMVSQNHPHSDRGPQVADVIQRRAEIFMDPQEPMSDIN